MSCIPNCRKNEVYNEKYLTPLDKVLVNGYDWAVENVDNLFYSLEVYEDEFNIEGEDINLTRFLENHPKILSTLREALLDWLEMGRNELITSMMDNYPIK